MQTLCPAHCHNTLNNLKKNLWPLASALVNDGTNYRPCVPVHELSFTLGTYDARSNCSRLSSLALLSECARHADVKQIGICHLLASPRLQAVSRNLRARPVSMSKSRTETIVTIGVHLSKRERQSVLCTNADASGDIWPNMKLGSKDCLLATMWLRMYAHWILTEHYWVQVC
jgi:hypothetical protein